MLIQHHDVGTKAFEPPVLLGLKYLADQRQIVFLHHANQQNRQIAGDSVGPEAGLSELITRQQVRRRAQGPVAVENSGSESFEERCVVTRNPQVAQGALYLVVGEGEGPRGSAGILILLSHGKSLL